MWTARFGAIESEGTEKRSNDVTPSKSHLELEIRMNGEREEKETNVKFKSNNYNHYVPGKSYKRKARLLSNRKIVTVSGDGEFSQKKTFR